MCGGKLYGVTSWGIECAKKGGIYANVMFYHHWISHEMKPSRLRKDQKKSKNIKAYHCITVGPP